MKERIILVVWALLLLLACQKDGSMDGNIPTNSDNFTDVVAEGGSFDPVSSSQEVVDSSSSDENRSGELWRCSTTTFEANYGGGGSEGFAQYNPNASVIYPGSLLQGKSLNKATPDVIAVKRSGGTISIDIQDGSPTAFIKVDEVSKSSITQAANDIIAGSTGAIPANMEFSYERIQSRQEMALALKVDYHSAFTEIEGKLSFSSDKSYNRTIVQLKQSYYTMSFDIPTSLESVFAPEVTPADLAKYVGPGNPATYVSDVTYGRIYYLLVETTSSETEMDAAISASFNGVVAGGGVEAEVNQLSKLSNLKIKLFAFGGEATSTLLTISNAGNLSDLGELLAESTDIRTGKPISYVVRSVYDNQIVSVAHNTRYDVTNCVALNPNGPPPPYLAHWAGLIHEFGPIGAATTLNGSTKFMLFNKTGDQYLISEQSTLKGPFPIEDLSTDAFPMDGVGAAAYIEGSSTSNTLMFFDTKGINYAYYDQENKRYLGSGPIADLGGGGFPFNLQGISAALNYGVEADAVTPDYYTNIRALFENNSLMYSLFRNKSFDSYDHPHHMNSFVLNETYPFRGVGAGIGFSIGNDRFWLLFSEQGDQYMIAVDDWRDYYIGPFGL